MTISESGWMRYIDRLAAINNTAARKFVAFLNTHETATAEGRKLALDYAAALVQKYGESAAAVACEMYDAVAEASGVMIPAAEPAAVATYGEVAKTVNGIMKQSGNPEYVGSGVSRLVKQAGVDTTVKNAIRDGAEWAWVPHGDTCSFCIMLASNGWQEASKKVLKGDHAEHVHANCDCTFAIRFDSRTNVAGYDPDALYEQYMSAEGDTWQEKLNSMRREQYAAEPEKYRAQKRAAYERRKINYDGVPKTWEKNLEGSDDDILRGTNPNYIKGLPETARKEQRDYNDNCTNCVVAYEMRCRGYDVTAQPLSANKKLRSSPFSAWVDGEKSKLISNNANDLMDYMESMPEGARVQIALSYKKTVWSQRNGHTCIVERKNGINIFKDPQNGAIIKNTEALFDGLDRFSYLRIDDKEITDRGISACRRRV